MKLNDCESLLRGGEVKDNVVYFRIAYDHDVDAVQKRAFKAGMQMWNKHSGKTRFVFDDATAGRPDFRLQKGAPRHLQRQDRDELQATRCATYESLGSYIWYSPRGMKLVIQKAGFEAAAAAYAHELGHALNLCHKPDSALMRAGDPNVFCHIRAKELPREIPEDDLEDAKACGHEMRDRASKEDEEIKRFRERTPFY